MQESLRGTLGRGYEPTRRSFPEIVREILQMEGRKKTHIMYGTGLTHPQLVRYLEILLGRGLLAKTADLRGDEIYVPTLRGRDLLKHLDSAMEYLERDDGRG